MKPDIEKAFIKKYFEYHDVFSDTKSTELDEAAKKELQTILDGKELEIDINEELEEVATQELKSIKDSAEVEKRRLELKDLNLSVRSYNALNRNFMTNIRTVGDLINLEEEDFRRTRNLGPKSAEEVIEIVHSLGLKMKWERNEETKEVENKNISELDEKSKGELKIADLKLPVQIHNCLARAGIDNVNDIINLEEENFSKIRNLGTISAIKVIEKIHSLDLKMKWEEDIEYEKVPEVKENILTSDEKSKTGILTIELDLSQRSFNCLVRYGFNNVDDIINIEEKRFREIRNLGQKSADEIIDKIHSLGLKMKWERDAEEKAATDAQLEDSIQQLKTAYSDLKAKDEEYEELKQQLKDSRETQKTIEINPNIEKQESESKEHKNDDPSYGEL